MAQDELLTDCEACSNREQREMSVHGGSETFLLNTVYPLQLLRLTRIAEWHHPRWNVPKLQLHCQHNNCTVSIIQLTCCGSVCSCDKQPL